MSAESGIPSALEAEKLAAAYQDSLARFKFEQETQRDKTVVLISGGALTVSFAFISTLVEHGAIVRLWPLIWAWAFWVGVLILTIIGYSLSISNYNHVIQALSHGRWGEARQVPRLSKVIEPLNNLVSVLAVSGFVLFGYFAIGNLARISNEKAQIASISSKTKGEAQIQGRSGPPTCQLGPAAAVGTPETTK
jgi:hypothetical protein